MKTIKNIFLSIVIALLLSAMIGCEKDEKPIRNEAKGYVLGVTGPCLGNALYIEIETPKKIGKKGTFNAFWSKDNPNWNYENAIGVPLFDKVNLPVELMKAGTFLHFEYRKYDPDNDLHYFVHKQICTMDQIPPNVNTYIITKIISFRPKK